MEEKRERLAAIVAQVGLETCGEGILGVSVGGAFYPDDGVDTETLLGAADRRMYSQKAFHRDLRATPALGAELARLDESISSTEPTRTQRPS